MREWLDHPWTIAAGGALLTAILAEVAPLHLFSSHVIPRLWTLSAYLIAPIQTPRWVLFAAPLTGIAVIVIAQYVVSALHIKRGELIFSGLCWERLKDRELEFRPICNHCRGPLHPKIQAEQRKDRNNVPFLFIPEVANTLFCPGCNLSTPLPRPWDEVAKEAKEFFTSALPQP